MVDKKHFNQLTKYELIVGNLGSDRWMRIAQCVITTIFQRLFSLLSK